MSALLRSMVDNHSRVETRIGSLTADAAWIDDQWSSIPAETYAAVATAIAEGDSAEAGHILEQAFSKIARREAMGTKETDQ
ncbi:MAG: hypothetical protein GAK28_00166 [Luteibacter sp.]|uniref:hypothetical protein n=1 Tax=Luteibacter sp. TaxID=1886636 RepID=UPI00137FE2C2|nr:hypothetical protein [Luteibacter sp.]KAF1009528.1 MAG: hypothetical protein GAK28_00166 [Luteibacter sp.]